MPIYEYYCRSCRVRFSHLARRLNAAAPSCPQCGGDAVERLISAAHLVRGKGDHRRELRQGASHVDGDDPQAMARFLKDSGRLEDADGLYGSKAYRELIERRIQGATDADLADLVGDLAGEVDASELAQLSSAVALSDQVENRMAAEGPPLEHGMGEAGAASESGHTQSRRSAPDVGWG